MCVINVISCSSLKIAIFQAIKGILFFQRVHKIQNLVFPAKISPMQFLNCNREIRQLSTDIHRPADNDHIVIGMFQFFIKIRPTVIAPHWALALKCNLFQTDCRLYKYALPANQIFKSSKQNINGFLLQRIVRMHIFMYFIFYVNAVSNIRRSDLSDILR